MRALGSRREIRVSSVDRLEDAQVSVTHSRGWDELGLTNALVGIQRAARRSRGMGDFWQHVLVAEGAMDVAIDLGDLGLVGLPVDAEVALDEVGQRRGVGALGDLQGERQLLPRVADAHRSCGSKVGRRFSRNAARPSAASGPRKLIIS